ncbi:hypothetical protein FPV67DRAFT_1460878 [Lyophyllum atratum]|nr:hypothetical protein FPV67DRAFT_1460878 [Lyophyllum atratum]
MPPKRKFVDDFRAGGNDNHHSDPTDAMDLDDEPPSTPHDERPVKCQVRGISGDMMDELTQYPNFVGTNIRVVDYTKFTKPAMSKTPEISGDGLLPILKSPNDVFPIRPQGFTFNAPASQTMKKKEVNGSSERQKAHVHWAQNVHNDMDIDEMEDDGAKGWLDLVGAVSQTWKLVGGYVVHYNFKACCLQSSEFQADDQM